jgi:hypothetical protein
MRMEHFSGVTTLFSLISNAGTLFAENVRLLEVKCTLTVSGATLTRTVTNTSFAD